MLKMTSLTATSDFGKHPNFLLQTGVYQRTAIRTVLKVFVIN